MAIAVDDLDSTLSELKEQGIEPEKPPYSVREGGSRLCFVRDPESGGVTGLGYTTPFPLRDLASGPYRR